LGTFDIVKFSVILHNFPDSSTTDSEGASMAAQAPDPSQMSTEEEWGYFSGGQVHSSTTHSEDAKSPNSDKER
jgi:hypothetical protein